MERITSVTEIVTIEEKTYNLDEVRSIMQDENKRAAYNGPSEIGYLAVQLGISFSEAADVLSALIQRDSLKRVENNAKVFQIAADMADNIMRRSQ